MNNKKTVLNNNCKNKYTIIAFFLFIFLYKLVAGIQGLNVYDEGFQLVGFNQIINNPESVQYQFLYYFSFLCGGLWNIVFGQFSIYGLRVLSALLETLTFFILYKTLKDVIRTRFIFIGIAIIILTSGSTSIFFHDKLTSFFNILAALFLYKSFVSNNAKFILLAGIVIGINVFVRIPNLAVTGLILSLIPFYLYNRNIKDIRRYFFNAVSGFVIGIGIVLLIMILMRHTHYMAEAILGQLSGDNDSSHSLARIFMTYVKLDYFPLSKYIAALYVPPLIILFSQKLSFKNKHFQKVLMCFSILLFCSILYIRNYYILLFNAFSTSILCISLFHFRNNRKIVYISTLGLLIEYLQPIGGDWGFGNMDMANILLSFTLAFGLSFMLIPSLKCDTIIKKYLNVILVILCSFLFFKGIVRTVLHEKWYGTFPLWTMTYKTNLDNVNILLDEKRGKQLDDLGAALKRYVRPDDYLFSIDECPISYYLSHTKPYLYNPLVWCYSTNELKKRLSQAEREIKTVPVVLLENGSCVHYSYINQKYNLRETYKNNNKKNRIYNNFLKKHGYKTVWENDKYMILLPHSK